MNNSAQEIIARISSGEISVSQAAKTYHISRVTIYKWLARSKRGEQLVKEGFVLTGGGNKITGETEKQILTIARKYPDLSKYDITKKLAEKYGAVVGVHGVYNTLQRHQITNSEQRKDLSDGGRGNVFALSPKERQELWTLVQIQGLKY